MTDTITGYLIDAKAGTIRWADGRDRSGEDADLRSQESGGASKEAETVAVMSILLMFPPPESARRGIERRWALLFLTTT